MKTTRPYVEKPDRQLGERPLTIDDPRNPLLPWLSAGEAPDDYEDIEYAASWTRAHAPEQAPRDQDKKV